jgi:hypothetical protein
MPSVAHVFGIHGRRPQRFAPPPPQTIAIGHDLQSSVPPHPSGIDPHSAPACAQVIGVQPHFLDTPPPPQVAENVHRPHSIVPPHPLPPVPLPPAPLPPAPPPPGVAGMSKPVVEADAPDVDPEPPSASPRKPSKSNPPESAQPASGAMEIAAMRRATFVARRLGGVGIREVPLRRAFATSTCARPFGRGHCAELAQPCLVPTLLVHSRESHRKGDEGELS